MSQAINKKEELLYSRLGGDPDLGEIVTMFVDEMPDRVSTLKTQFDGNDLENLRRTAHQLKGAAGSYGFDPISPAAAKLENSLRDSEPIDQIRVAVEELIDMCSRVRAGSPER